MWIFFEKTPIYVLMPHISYIMAHTMVSRGTKIVLFLRDPIKRFISGYFQKARKFEITNYFDQYYEKMNGENSPKQYNKDIESLFQRHTNKHNNTSVKDEMVKRYQYFHYSCLNEHSRGDCDQYNWLWSRGCYAPQILTWIRYISELMLDFKTSQRYKNSFKIIQSEVFWRDETSYEQTMHYLICYIQYHYGSDARENDYDLRMKRCRSNQTKTYQIHRSRSKTKGFVADKKLIDQINGSYAVCNQWLKVVLADYKHIVDEDFFDWKLW